MTRGLDPVAWAAMMALTALTACGDDSAGPGGQVANGGNGGTGEGAGTPGNSSTSIMIGDGGMGGEAPPFVCDPAAEPGSLYELSAEDVFAVEPVSMCKFRGDVLLIVNTAAN